MKTWMVELGVVIAVLASVVLIAGRSATEWIGAAAVACSFAHGQVASRLAEREAARDRPEVACHSWATRYFVAKEALWLIYFAANGAWSALAGVVLFLLYPVWRSAWRRRHPIR